MYIQLLIGIGCTIVSGIFIQTLTGKKGKNAATFDTVPIDKASTYACEDADITLMASQILNEKMETLSLSKLFQ